MIYQDLMTVPYKPFGRTLDGMDCYGFVIFCCDRVGKKLKDIPVIWDRKTIADKAGYLFRLNVQEIPEAEQYCILQSDYKQELHVGFMLNKKTVIHMTYTGVRISPLIIFQNPKFYRVI